MYTLHNLSRQEYIDSINAIDDKATRNFARISLAWWDKHFSWRKQGCVVLRDENQTNLSYIFYKIDRYKERLNIHTIFTPKAYRHQGYARLILNKVFSYAASVHVERFHLSCVASSLIFYKKLGFIFWGLNSKKDYYCNMPLPTDGLCGVHDTSHDIDTLMGKERKTIENKIAMHHESLSTKEQKSYDTNTAYLDEAYILDEFLEYNHENI